MHTENEDTLAWVDKLTSRHIARGLDQLGPVAPALSSSIKRSFRFLAQDIKDVLASKEHKEERDDDEHEEANG